MTIPEQLATHLRNVHFGGNWADNHLRQHLEGLPWGTATLAIPGFNTIAAITCHLKYFVAVQSRVLQGGPLEGQDKLSWVTPAITDQAAWDALLDEFWSQAGELADRVAAMPEELVFQPFGDPKYGTYYANIQGLVEHAHYHLGQIVILKRLLEKPAGT